MAVSVIIGRYRIVRIYPELLGIERTVRAVCPIPDASAEHRYIGFAVAVIVTDHGFVAILPELEPGRLVVAAPDPVPCTVRRSEHALICPAVTVIIRRLRYVPVLAPLNERYCSITAVQPVPETGRRPEYRNVGLAVVVKIARYGYIRRLSKVDGIEP